MAVWSFRYDIDIVLRITGMRHACKCLRHRLLVFPSHSIFLMLIGKEVDGMRMCGVVCMAFPVGSVSEPSYPCAALVGWNSRESDR